MKITRETLAFCLIATLIASLMAFHYLTGTASGTDSAASGVPLDDVYIHFQYAKNLADYGHFYYNVGDDETGATSPLWVLILSMAYKLGMDLIAASKAIGFLLHLFSTVLIFLIFKERLKMWWIGWAGAFALLLSPMLFFYSLSGMDVSLFVFLLISVFYFFIRGGYAMTGVALGLSILARPEGLIMFGLLLVYAAFKRKNLREFLKMFVIAMAIAAPWFIYCFLVTGRPLPSTFYAKIEPITFPSIENFIYILLWPIYEPLFSLGAIFLMLAVGGWRYFRETDTEISLFLIFLLVYLLTFSIFAHSIFTWWFHTYYTRYLAPVFVFLIYFMIVGLDFLLTNYRHRLAPLVQGIIYLFIVFSFLLNIGMTANLSKIYSWDANAITTQHVALAKWVDENIPQGARIGVNDAGAIIFFSSASANHTFADLMGLNTHRRIGKDLNEFIDQEELDYLVIYDEWFPGIKEKFSFEERYNVTLKHNTVAGADTMHVYRILGKNKTIPD